MEEIRTIQSSLRQLSGIEDSNKMDGLRSLDKVLRGEDRFLFERGYHQVIYNELIRLIKFEESIEILSKALDVLELHYFKAKEHQDEIGEELIYKVGRSRNFEVSQVILEKISTLVDILDDGIAKHSKQLLKLADLNDMPSLDVQFREILGKMNQTLPVRK